MTNQETTAKLAAVNARIAASAMQSNADCIRMSARIQELEGALRAILHAGQSVPDNGPLPVWAIEWDQVHSALDSCATNQSSIWNEAIERCATLTENFRSDMDVYHNYPHRPALVAAIRTLKAPAILAKGD